MDHQQLQYTIFFFSSDGTSLAGQKYELLMRCAEFGDAQGFRAIWTPERHFSQFGGLYPNPSVLGAAIAARTSRIEVRAGSVVLPLHNPIRVAEEWAVVDNLSNGRVALAFASGWHKTDFTLRPEVYPTRRESMAPSIELVRKLWRGERVTVPGVGGESVEVSSYPRPIQPELRYWLTCSSPEGWTKAGAIGANVLSMLGASLGKLQENIARYRKARAEAGLDPESGVVSIMLHTYVDNDEKRAKDKVRAPLRQYLKEYISQYEVMVDKATQVHVLANQDQLLDFAFERYYEQGALLGPQAKCARLLGELRGAGVNEIACLVDFGVGTEDVIKSLSLLKETRLPEASRPRSATPPLTPATAEKTSKMGQHNRLQELTPELRSKLAAKLAQRSQKAAPKAISLCKAPVDWLKLDQRSLLTMIAAGDEPPVDAVSITCLSDRLVNKGVALEDLTHKFCGDMPLLSNIRELSIGRIATLTLPRTYAQIYVESGDIVRLVRQSLHIASLVGAKAVSLTGLIPSATDYGRAIHAAPHLPAMTTGHATTCSSVVLALKRLLEEAGRRLSDEDLCFIGLGSVGSSTLRLMLQVLEHPRSLTLCDVYAKQADVEAIMAEIREKYGFAGELRFAPSQRVCPDEVYRATVIVGATNAPNVLDIDRVKPGTLVADDSDPHCFDAQRAIARFEQRGDILFTEGGALRSPDVIQHRIHVPEQFEWALEYPADDDNAHHITGCILSSLFSAKYGYASTMGMVKEEDARAHWDALAKFRFSAANLHCGTYRLGQERSDDFRKRFGATVRSRETHAQNGRTALAGTEG